MMAGAARVAAPAATVVVPAFFRKSRLLVLLGLVFFIWFSSLLWGYQKRASCILISTILLV
jgi:hypothetical protein